LDVKGTWSRVSIYFARMLFGEIVDYMLCELVEILEFNSFVVKCCFFFML